MSKDECKKFIEVYEKAQDNAGLYPCNEAEELSLRSIATEMWDAGRSWSDTHTNE